MVAENHIEKEFNNFLHILKATEKQPVIDTIILVIEETVGSFTKVHDVVYELTSISETNICYFDCVTNSALSTVTPGYIDVYNQNYMGMNVTSVLGSYNVTMHTSINHPEPLAHFINAIDSSGKGLRVKHIEVAGQSNSTPIHYIVKLNNTYENVDVFAGCKPIQL